MPVYDQSVWWSDRYDPLAYGREFDFSRTFFDQLAELHAVVPKLSIHNAKSENCEYTNYSAENRNCYLAVGALGSEDVYYSYRVFYSKSIVDSFGLNKSELCYECCQGTELYRCVYTLNCRNSSDLYMCDDCIGCSNCFGCIGLRNQEFYIFNRPVSPSDYPALVSQLKADHVKVVDNFEKLRTSVPQRDAYVINCETSYGDQLRNCRNCRDSYFLFECQDSVYARNGENNRDCADTNFHDNCELQYESANLEKNYRVGYASLAWYVSDSFYILSCFNSRNLFGCCGMKHNQYCILNKQYSISDYDRLAKKIALHMSETGEWGQFFPPNISPFLYSETVASEICSTIDTERLKNLKFNVGESTLPPVRNDPSAVNCCHCCRPFRILAQEKFFYSQLNVPEPIACPDCRHLARMKKRRPMQLHRTSCCRCAKSVFTSLANSEVVCEACVEIA